MDRMGALERLGAHLRQPQRTDLAGLDQARHCADYVLDRHLRIAAMAVVEIDAVDAEARERCVAGAGAIERKNTRR